MQVVQQAFAGLKEKRRALAGRTGCGVCVDVCPFECISPSPENTAVYLGKVQVNEKTCVGCLLCEEVCGWDGIYIMPSGQKEAFLSSLGYETGESDAA